LKFGFPVTIKQQKETIYKATDTNGFVPVLQGGNIMVVQHNLTAMNSNRMLGVTTKTQAKSTEKLSSGYKINRAADDAAGLSISEKMRKQIRGLTQASLNAQDGISAVQTAEGALNEVQDMLQRMNELAVKSANGTNSATDRTYIQNEIDQLTTEIDRVSETTKFNETYLLKGDKAGDKATDFQYKEVEVTSQDLYYVKGGKVETVKKGTYKSAIDNAFDYYTKKDGVQVGEKIDAGNRATYAETAKVKVITDDVYVKDATSGNFISAKGQKFDETGATKYYTLTAGANGLHEAAEKNTPNTNEYDQVKATVYDKDGNTYEAGTYVKDIEKFYGSIKQGILAGDSKVDNIDNVITKGGAQFTDKEGNKIAANGLGNYLDNDGTLKADAGLYINGRVATQDDVKEMVDTTKTFDTGALTLKLHVGADATDNNQISVKLDAMSAKGLGVQNLKVDGADDTNAKNAVDTIKEAIQKVSTQRSALGAVQNRLEHTISNLDNVVENTTSAESQIRDTDMATEMVKYSNNNILAQAGQAMLAQANQSNQGVLSLLQ
jgi:flagellin